MDFPPEMEVEIASAPICDGSTVALLLTYLAVHLSSVWHFCLALLLLCCVVVHAKLDHLAMTYDVRCLESLNCFLSVAVKCATALSVRSE